MKNLITIILSVGLSVLVVWLLLPSMEQYYRDKGETTTEQVEQEVEEEEVVEVVPSDGQAPITLGITNYGGVFITYTMLNNTDKPIKNVKVRILYYDKKGTQIHYEDKIVYCTLEPGLTQSFEHHRASEVRSGYGLKIQVLEYNIKGLFD